LEDVAGRVTEADGNHFHAASLPVALGHRLSKWSMSTSIASAPLIRQHHDVPLSATASMPKRIQ